MENLPTDLSQANDSEVTAVAPPHFSAAAAKTARRVVPLRNSGVATWLGRQWTRLRPGSTRLMAMILVAALAGVAVGGILAVRGKRAEERSTPALSTDASTMSPVAGSAEATEDSNENRIDTSEVRRRPARSHRRHFSSQRILLFLPGFGDFEHGYKHGHRHGHKDDK